RNQAFGDLSLPWQSLHHDLHLQKCFGERFGCVAEPASGETVTAESGLGRPHFTVAILALRPSPSFVCLRDAPLQHVRYKRLWLVPEL
ncbi:hypothetical protein BaRGS_00002076, partial [Batillaria attramentaria]